MRTESPADTSRTRTPIPFTPSMNASTAGMRRAASTNDGCTINSPTRAYRATSSSALKWSRFGCETIIASILLELSRPIIGSNARAATLPVELDPPSKSTVDPPLRTTYAEPSPTASIVISNRGLCAWCCPLSRLTVMTPIAPHAATRQTRALLRNAAKSNTIIATPVHEAIDPTCTVPPPAVIDRSTNSTCSQAEIQRIGPTGIVSGGQIAPMIAFGYAIASVTVESGVQRNVSRVPNGCSEPNCTRTTGTLAKNAASPAAIARDAYSPLSAIHAG